MDVFENQNSTERDKKTWLEKLIHVLPVFPLLMIGAGIFVPEIERARMLNFSWVPVLLPAPLAALAIYFVMGWRLRRSIGLWAWPIGYLLATPLFFLPTAMLALNTRAIALNQTLQPAETVALRTWFPHPFIQYSSSSEGNVLLVRKNDFSEALVEYARTNRAN